MNINGPIYIGGVSYSGKTQLRLLLSSHPNIIISRRTYLWRKFNHKYGDLKEEKNFEACLEAILKLASIQELNPVPTRIRDKFWDGESSYERLFSIIHQQYAESMGKTRWGIQIGLVEKDADLIFDADPNAKLIQVVRNPIDRIEESIKSSSRRKLSLGLETSLWLESSKLAIKNLKKYPRQYKVVKWEDLLADVDQTLEGVCAFLGEDFRPDMIKSDEFSNMGLVVKGEQNSGLRQLAIKDWTSGNQITNNEKLYILSNSSSEMSFFGYKDEKIHLHSCEKFKYLSLDYPAYFLGSAIKKPLNKFRQIKQTILQ